MSAPRQRRPRGSGSVKAENRVWYGRIRVGRNANPSKFEIGPERQPGSREGLTSAQAEARWQKMLADINATTRRPLAERMTLADAGAALVRHTRVVHTINTADSYRVSLDHHLAPSPELPDALAAITSDHVEGYVAAEMNPPPDKPPRAHKSIKNDIIVLSRVFTYAMSKGWVDSNPCVGVTRPVDDEKLDEIRFLEDEELEALLRATADTHRHHERTRRRIRRMHELRSEGLTWKQVAGELGVSEPTVHYYRKLDPDELDPEREAMAQVDRTLYLVAALIGLRQGELLGLPWLAVEWPGAGSSGRIRVERQFSRGRFSKPKGKRSRTVPMVERAAQELARLQLASDYRSDRDLVFAHPETGKPLDRTKLLKRYKATLVRAGLEERPFHDLRHTYAVKLARGGLAMSVLQAWMGHANITTTERYSRYQTGDNDTDLAEGAFAAAESRHKLRHKLSETEGISEPSTPANTGVEQ